ncbi:MAG: hypothetical protein ACSLE5_15480 [Porticoccaceae bacterium]
MAIIAIISSLVAYNVYRASTDPNVIVYADPDPKRPSIINLVIKNIGTGPARNIEFSLSKPSPQDAFGFDDAKLPEQMNKGALVTGMAYLAPNQAFTITWGQYGGLSKYLGSSVISVTSTYENPSNKVFKRRLSSTSEIDVMALQWLDASDHNWDKKVAEHLKSVSQTLVKINGNIEKLNAGER